MLRSASCLALVCCLSTSLVTTRPAVASPMDGVVGAMLGAAIMGSMMQARPQPGYRRVVRGRAPARRYAGRPSSRNRHVAPGGAGATINASADPFASSKSSAPIPVSAKQ